MVRGTVAEIASAAAAPGCPDRTVEGRTEYTADPPPSAIPEFPTTRYLGSKRRVAQTIIEHVSHLDFHSVLDAFGGTGAVSYAFKQAGKQVAYNDLLGFNHQIGLALIENRLVRLEDDEIELIGSRRPGRAYPNFIERTFEGVYYTREENRWLDAAVANIGVLRCPYKRALAWFALVQSALIKRPYNLFHRGNLYMRTSEVPRTFGNKASWDRGFLEHFRRFARQANAAVFDSGVSCQAACRDALATEPAFDLVYVDTPYVNRAGVGVDYRRFYHFLEGMVDYERWPTMLDHGPRHLPLLARRDPWSDRRTSPGMFFRLFKRFRRSILVVSYRSDGIPRIDQLVELLRSVRSRVDVIELGRRQYALSKNRRAREVLLIGT